MGRYQQLVAARRASFRLDPSRPIGDGAGLRAFVEERGLALVSGRGGLPSLPEAIVGHDIRGSWMADEAVHHIYAVLNAGLTEPGIGQLPLVDGKWTAVAARLQPAVRRIALDEARVGRATAGLSESARALLDQVLEAGVLTAPSLPDGNAARVRAARKELETGLLVWAEEVHTEAGHHLKVLRPWLDGPWGGLRGGEPSWESSLATLMDAAIHAAVLAPASEIRRWFRFDPEPTPWSSGRYEVLDVDGKAWWASP